MAKGVQLDCLLTIDWGAGAVDASEQLTATSLELMRAEIEASVLGFETDRYELGAWQPTWQITIRPDSDLAFVDNMAAAIKAGTNVTVVFAPSTASISSTNKRWTFPVLFSNIPSGLIGAARNQLREASVTVKVNGQISRYDGTTTVTYGS